MTELILYKMGADFFEVAAQHGFWEEDNSPEATKKAEKIALMHSELSEALEGVRKPKQDSHCPEFDSETVELADAIIRILDYCFSYDLDIDGAVAAKNAYNKTRPYKHGKTI